MLFLSRLILDPASRQVQRELANPYELHRTLMHAFPDDVSSTLRLLYRLETNRQPPFLVLLVQSTLPPNWQVLPQAKYFLIPPQTKSLDGSFEPGSRFVFRLLANPTKRTRSDVEDQPGKRVALLHPQEQEAWLHRKAEHGGFDVLAVNLTQLDHQLAYKRRTESNQVLRITHQAVRFDGMLQVKDSELFEETVTLGIGSAKGFGFGLLSLAKLQ